MFQTITHPQAGSAPAFTRPRRQQKLSSKPGRSPLPLVMLHHGPGSSGLTPGQPPAAPAPQVPTFTGSVGHTDVSLSQPPCNSWRNELSWRPGDTGPGRGEPRLDPGTGHLDWRQKHMHVISQCTETPFGAVLFTEAFFPYFINLNIEIFWFFFFSPCNSAVSPFPRRCRSAAGNEPGQDTPLFPRRPGQFFLLTLIHCDSAKKVLSILQAPQESVCPEI